jgi:hypothetical protein
LKLIPKPIDYTETLYNHWDLNSLFIELLADETFLQGTIINAV